jgi:SAM-dependent methyltransferase
LPNAEPARLWLRFDGEATVCPACGSPRITLLDAFPIPRDQRRRRVSFLTGCRECGLLFANPLPTPEQLEHFYGRDGAWAAARARRTQRLAAMHAQRRAHQQPAKPARRRPRDLLMDALGCHVNVDTPKNGAKVLDFGCGDGKFLDRFQDRGWDTYGIEPSSDIASLRHNRLDSPPQDRSFDLVLLHHVLEHVTDPLQLLRQLAGALRDGGTLFVSVPRLDTLAKHGDFKYCINARNHPVCFSEACLRGLLARAGFSAGPRLDAPELDAVLSQGMPLRLRLLATRTTAPPTPTGTPLDAALDALSLYARAHDGFGARVRRMLPVRMRGAMLDRARER